MKLKNTPRISFEVRGFFTFSGSMVSSTGGMEYGKRFRLVSGRRRENVT